MTQTHTHRWRFFRAGGFDQVQLESPADLAALRGLDQKLWASLACPVSNLELDRRMLDYIDLNRDGRIRAPEILDAVDWTLARLVDPEVLFQAGPLRLQSLTDDAEGVRLRLAAQRLLDVLGRPTDDCLTLADTDDLALLFPPHEYNGDGLVPATLTEDEGLQAAIADIIACQGAETDRSGEAAIGEEQIAAFFEQARQLHDWQAHAAEQGLEVFGEGTGAAVEALSAVRGKVDDYFNRVAMAEFDPRAQVLMNPHEEELVRLASLSLADADELAGLPLAVVQHGDRLPLEKGLNPAWQSAVDALRERVVKPIYGEQDSLTLAQWRHLVALCGDYLAWQAEAPQTAIAGVLERERILELVEQGVEARLLALVEQDKAVGEAADGLVELDKLIRLRHGLLRLLRNFVSFQSFYSRQDKAVFQAGTLYIEGKSCDLVVEVADIEAHAKVAAASDCFLLYCACTRRGEPVRGRETLNIVVAVTAGTEGDLQAGRHGLFYDRDGNDWDATVVKLVQNAISIREAFWSPYRRISGLVSEQVQKLATSRDADMVSKTAGSLGDSAGTAPAATPAAFDIARFAGIFAAIGLAIGALGTALAAVVTGILSLAWWQVPLLLLGVLLAISGPSMLLAWFKLRRRSLGPILDGNGWAVNAQARISIPFGTELTQMAVLPPDSGRALRDPYAEKPRLWPWVLALLLVVGVGYYAWSTGVFKQDVTESVAPVEVPAAPAE
ncbi:hypothetical protein HW090_08280 [Pseudomonas sp. ABC1]|uniref:hypothetical protein n=1 Tax=Pseudomonas sp. ABC1 TaxID=2748080 RepID=UPI0015C3BF94|nr:hypothetical protein [Pseudomonas sp. ABC1]QLF93188.1 hypothetical protein HW090_08280 [Pseudomonas sp. ABC1]